MKATIKGRYEADKSSTALATVELNAGDVNLKASMTNATFAKGSSLNGLTFSLDKPGSFIIDYNVPKKDFRFQFMNTVKVLEKPVSLTYVHAHGDNRMAVDTSVAFDPENKVTMSYAFGSGNCKVKYVFAHGEMRKTLIEPCYDVSKNVWDVALSRKFEGGDSIKATYHTSAKTLGLEWNRDSKVNGCFKAHFPWKSESNEKRSQWYKCMIFQIIIQRKQQLEKCRKIESENQDYQKQVN